MRNTLVALCLAFVLHYICVNTSQAQGTIGKEADQQAHRTTKSDSAFKLPEPEMVLVEGGSFMMGLGTDSDHNGFQNTVRTHKVTLSSFKIGKYEISQSEWKAVMGESSNFSQHQGCANCPVEEVSWNDIQLFIQKLNAATGKHYQLPTEAQWEYAARGGNKSKGYKYAGSDNVNDITEPGGTFTGKTHPVGSKRPNELRIYDMSANLAEWCGDWFDPHYIPGATTDPPGAPSGVGHFIRGGSWGIHPNECLITSFKMGYPNDRNARVGFRLVLMP